MMTKSPVMTGFPGLLPNHTGWRLQQAIKSRNNLVFCDSRISLSRDQFAAIIFSVSAIFSFCLLIGQQREEKRTTFCTRESVILVQLQCAARNTRCTAVFTMVMANLHDHGKNLKRERNQLYLTKLMKTLRIEQTLRTEDTMIPGSRHQQGHSMQAKTVNRM